MGRTIDKSLGAILKKYGADPATDIWDCHGTWVAYHKTLERIATQAGIGFDLPQVIRHEHDECVVLVSGTLGERSEWSFGEARIGLNYKVAGKQAGYPYSMAEKRGKDRVILKLLGLAGHIYSEEEADDFKAPPKQDDMGGEMDARTVVVGVRNSAQAKRDGDDVIVSEMEEASTLQVLHDWGVKNRARIQTLPVKWQNVFWERYDAHEQQLSKKEAA